MNEDIIWIGPCPSHEDCSQVGSPDYARNAKIECRAYIDAIRKVCGQEPEGTRLTIKGQPHDFGDYFEVALLFDGDNRVAAEYAQKVDEHAPRTWEESDMVAPLQHGQGRS